MSERQPLLVTTREARDIWSAVRRILKMRGHGVTNSPDGITIAAPQEDSRRGSSSASSSSTQYKIKTAADSNGVAVANTWDGTTLGTVDVPILMSTRKGKVGDIFRAIRADFTGVTYGGADVKWIEVAIGSVDSPTTFSPSGTTADTTTWSIQADATPMSVDLVTRVYYDSTGHLIYQFKRTFKYTSRGMLYEITGETRSTIDTLEGC